MSKKRIVAMTRKKMGCQHVSYHVKNGHCHTTVQASNNASIKQCTLNVNELSVTLKKAGPIAKLVLNGSRSLMNRQRQRQLVATTYSWWMDTTLITPMNSYDMHALTRSLSFATLPMLLMSIKAMIGTIDMMAPSKETSVEGALPLIPATPIHIIAKFLHQAVQIEIRDDLESASDSSSKNADESVPCSKGDKEPEESQLVLKGNLADAIKDAVQWLKNSLLDCLIDKKQDKDKSQFTGVQPKLSMLPPAIPKPKINAEVPESSESDGKADDEVRGVRIGHINLISIRNFNT
ncbi:hypothetical protein ARMGADRAFT_1038561 [Armillaria gallica]|uniref:Uncharacterized protein n=1 Tax=Armillaria gallica TaxID=47427 RepID=A0A2H3CHL3_ARMGA|nr:hypothetical protein ARMGADRAFT_1038561 [Armillaria gallica]